MEARVKENYVSIRNLGGIHRKETTSNTMSCLKGRRQIIHMQCVQVKLTMSKTDRGCQCVPCKDDIRIAEQQ